MFLSQSPVMPRAGKTLCTLGKPLRPLFCFLNPCGTKRDAAEHQICRKDR